MYVSLQLFVLKLCTYASLKYISYISKSFLCSFFMLQPAEDHGHIAFLHDVMSVHLCVYVTFVEIITWVPFMLGSLTLLGSLSLVCHLPRPKPSALC